MRRLGLVVGSVASWRLARKLRLDRSPEQIAGWPRRSHSENEASLVSHETIYRSLFVQARGVLKKQKRSPGHNGGSPMAGAWFSLDIPLKHRPTAPFAR